MNLKKTLTLAAVLVAVLAYIRLVEMPAEKAKEGEALLLSGATIDNIKSVSIKRGDEVIGLNRAQNSSDEGSSQWQIQVLGYKEPDPGVLNSLLSSITQLKSLVTIEAAEVESDLSVYGLSNPDLVLKVSYNDKDHEITFGKKNDFTGNRYIKISDDTNLYLASDELFTAASKSRSDFRNKTPISFLDNELATIKIKSSKRDYEFVQKEDGTWRSVKPFDSTLSPLAIAELTRTVRNLSSVKFYDPEEGKPVNTEKFSLDKPLGTVELIFKEDTKAEPIVVSLANKKIGDDQFFVGVSGIDSVFSVATDPLPSIFKDITLYREKNLVRFSSDDVKSVLFEGKLQEDTPLKLEKLRGKGDVPEWRVDSDTADSSFAFGLVHDISEVKAESFPTGSQDFGFDTPLLKMTIAFEGKDNNPLTFVVGNKIMEGNEVKGYYAASGDLSEPFVISEATLNRITPKKQALLPVTDTGDTKED